MFLQNISLTLIALLSVASGEVWNQAFILEEASATTGLENVQEHVAEPPPPHRPQSELLLSLLEGPDPIQERLSELEQNVRLHPFPGYERFLKKLESWRRSKKQMRSKLETLLINFNYELSRIIILKPVQPIPGQDMCGRATETGVPYVIGGNDVDIKLYPWMAQLTVVRGSIEESPIQVEIKRCGATVISSEWLLTAAHCVPPATQVLSQMVTFPNQLLSKYLKTPEVVHQIGAVVGTKETVTDSDKLIRFREIIPHEGFGDNFKNDIALIRLEKPLNFSSSSVRPICLPKEGELNGLRADIDRCTVAGWGLIRLSPPTQPINLQAAHVFLKDLDRCNRTYQNLKTTKNITTGELRNMYIPEGHLCAGGDGGVPDACFGDSGGILMCPSPKTNKLLASGIVSFGPDARHMTQGEACGSHPGAYTDLRLHLTWIRNTILARL